MSDHDFTLHDLIAPAVPLIVDHNESPEDFEWENADASYAAAKKLFPEVRYAEGHTPIEEYKSVAPGSILHDPCGAFVFGVPERISRGTPAHSLLAAAALVIVTHDGNNGDAELSDIERATENMLEALKEAGIDADRIGAEESPLALPDDLGELIQDEAAFGWRSTPAQRPPEP